MSTLFIHHQCLIFAAKMNAMTLMEESVCIRPYSSNSLREYIFPVRRTVYRVMAEIGLNHKPKRKPNAITKADREASKSDDLIKRDFAAEKPLEKCMTDMTEIKASDGKLYVSAIFDCYDLAVLGLAMDTNMRSYPMRTNLRECLQSLPDAPWSYSSQ